MKVVHIQKQVSVNIVQITTVDERWYHLLPDRFFPSATWISSYVRKSEAFIRWFAENGYNRALEIRQAAGNKGSKVHNAIHDYVSGKVIKMDDVYMNHDTGNLEELSVEEYDCIVSFHDWWQEAKPKLHFTEQVVLNEQIGYAGTLDMIVSIKGQRYIVDIKTSSNIYLEHELQVSSYLHCLPDMAEHKIAVLQVGYGRNKKGFKFTELEDKFELFLAAKKFWHDDNPDSKPFQRNYPTFVSMNPLPETAADAPTPEAQIGIDLAQPQETNVGKNRKAKS